LFILGLALVAWELGFRWQWWSIFPALTLLLWCDPIIKNLQMGQLSFHLAFFLMAGWWCQRRGYDTAAGLLVGTAATLKLFPLLFLIYFLASRRWGAAVSMIVATISWNLLAVGLFGIQEYQTYLNTVLPSLKVHHTSVFAITISGFTHHICHSLGLSGANQGLSLVLRGVFFFTWIYAVWRNPKETDLTFSLTLLGMILLSPISWTMTLVVLTLPLLLLSSRLSVPILFSLYALISFPPETLLLWCYPVEVNQLILSDSSYFPPRMWLIVSPITLGLIAFYGTIFLQLPKPEGDEVIASGEIEAA
jgi:hypothetical protein